MNMLLILLVAVLALVAGGAVVWAMRAQMRVAAAELKARMLEEQGELLRSQLTQSATNVAEEILRKNEEAQRSRDLMAQERLASQLKPVTETLEKFKAHVDQVEKARAEDAGGLKEQIAQMVAAAQATREETLKLTNALKRGAGIQGRWGEQMLRNVLELAGLRAGVDFEEQVHTSDEDGNSRPDVVVRLPGSSYFVIDAKVSLNDYEAFLSAQDDVSRELALKAHCDSIRRHVTQLSSKAYWAKFDKPPMSRSPDVVVMFVPLESAYACAVEMNPNLIAEAWERKVCIVTPSAMFPLLRAVAYGWRAEDHAANAREIAASGRELHKRVSLIARYASDLGGALNKAVNHYNDFIGSLERNVLTQAKRFEALAVQSERPIVDPPLLDAHTKPMTKLIAAEGEELAALAAKD